MIRNRAAGLLLAGMASLVLPMLTASPAHALTPLATPTRVEVIHIDENSADMDWLRDASSAQDIVERRINGVWREYARGLFGVLALTNLTPATTYTFRVYSIPYPGSDLYTASARSAPVTFTTLAGPDIVAPSTPPAPIFGNITPTSVSIDWGDATDNVQVTGYYLEELIGGVWTVIRTVSAGNQFQGVAGLQPATAYSFAVVAFDARGNTSGRSAAGTVTTLATTAALTCTVAINQYPPGFTASVILLNTTTTIINGWTIGFTLAPAATLTTTFNGVVTRSGSTGTITPASYDTVIPPSAQFTVGFLGTVSPFAPPTNFTFNGAPCPPA